MADRQAPSLEEDTDLHFVSFVEHNGSLIELDGRRNSPINHGKIKKDLLEVSSASPVVVPFLSSDHGRAGPERGSALAEGMPGSPMFGGLTEHSKLSGVQDTVEVVKRIMELTQSIQFNLVALSPATDDE